MACIDACVVVTGMKRKGTEEFVQADRKAGSKMFLFINSYICTSNGKEHRINETLSNCILRTKNLTPTYTHGPTHNYSSYSNAAAKKGGVAKGETCLEGAVAAGAQMGGRFNSHNISTLHNTIHHRILEYITHNKPCNTQLKTRASRSRETASQT